MVRAPPALTHAAGSGTRIYGEQIRLLVRHRIDLPINVLAAGIVCVIVWRQFAPSLLLGWLGVFCLVIAARFLSRRLFHTRAPDAAGMPRWGRVFTLNALLTASLWGTIGSVVLWTADPEYRVFIVFVLGGIMAGGVAANAVFLPAMLAFQIPTIFPIIIILFSLGDRISIAMATMLSGFAAVLIGTGLGINRSVTENLRLRFDVEDLLEERRRESAAAAILAAVVEASDDAMVSAKLTQEIISWNRGAERTFGYTAAEMVGQDAGLLVAEDHRHEIALKRDLLVTGARVEPFDSVVLCKDGSRLPVSVSVSPNADGEGRLTGVSFIIRSIAERLKAAHDLAYRDRLMHAVALGAAVLVKADTLDAAMPVALRILGETLEVDRVLVLQDQPTLAVLYLWQLPSARPQADISIYAIPDSDAVAITAWRAGMAGGNALIAQHATTLGAVRHLLDAGGTQSLLAVPIAAGETVWGNLGIESTSRVRDWTDYEIDTLKIFGEIAGSLIVHHETAVALDETMARFRIVTTSAKDGIVMIGATDCIELWNPAAERMLGYSPAEAIGRSVGDFIAPQSKLAFANALAAFDTPGELRADGLTLEIVAQRKDGTEIALEISFAALRVVSGWGGVGILRDITERKASEAKLIFANTLLKSEMEASHSGIVVFDKAANVVMYNQHFADIWELPRDRLAGVTLAGLLAMAAPLLTDPEKFDAGVTRLLGHPELDSREEYSLTDGRIINREIRRLSGPDQDYLGRACYFNDVTEERNAASKLQFANLLLKTQMEASLDAILIVDKKMKIIAFNEHFGEMWQIPRSEIERGDDAPVLVRVIAKVKDQASFSAGVEYLYAHPDEDRHDEFEMADGRVVERDAIALAADGRYLGRAWFFRDITERKAAAAYALKMARYDVLTGLANRAVFVEALQHAIAATKRGEKGFAVIYLDLDHFKDVNDTLGHPVGDELLKLVAGLLTSTTRETDTVARFGGDEFAVVVSDISDPADAAILANKLIVALAVPFHVQGSEIHSGASIGIATYGADAPDAESLLSHADVALYRAKAEGRGGYRFFTQAMDIEVQSRVKLGGELRDALADGQLFLMYQPQVAMATSRIDGMEALIRWQHPEHGVLGPEMFIPLAEQIGIIDRLGHWVLWTACRQAKVWLDAGIAPVRMAVNVSALQFKAPAVLEADIVAALRETGLRHDMLELELTESVLMGVTSEHSDVLKRLRQSGVTIAIDDFGTGYSSLEYLRRFPANRIKIAQVFVKDLETKPDDAAIIKATIGLARELAVEVIAEGIETEAQARLIAGWGCGEAQGFLFSQPLDAAAAALALAAGTVAYRMPP